MSNITARNYSVTAVILILGFLIVAYLGYSKFLPEYQLASDQQKIAESEKIRLEKAVASVQTFITNFQSQKQNVSKVDLALPTANSDMANFINSLSELAQQSQVALTNFQITNADTETPAIAHSIQTQQIGFNATSADYPAFLNFLSKVELHLRLIDIDEITLTNGTDDGQVGGLKYGVRLRTYFQQ